MSSWSLPIQKIKKMDTSKAIVTVVAATADVEAIVRVSLLASAAVLQMGEALHLALHPSHSKQNSYLVGKGLVPLAITLLGKF